MTQSLEIAVLKIHRVNDSKIKAFVDVTINDCLLIKGIRIIQGKNGLFISLPVVKAGAQDRWYEQVRCLNEDVRQTLTSKILAAYER